MSKITNSWWFTPMMGQSIGIIKTIDDITGEVKFRIGTGLGLDEKQDATLIQQSGARFYPEVFNND